MRVKFDEDPLAVKKNNYTTKIVNTFIVYNLYTLPKNSLINFTLKKYLFGATNLIQSKDKEKWVYSGTTFDGKGTRRFGNDYAMNDVILFVDNSSSSHADNCKNFLILGEGDTFGINVSFGGPEKNVYYWFQFVLGLVLILVK